MKMTITEIIPGDVSGFCDIETGECVVVETDTPSGTEVDEPSHGSAPEDPSRRVDVSRHPG